MRKILQILIALATISMVACTKLITGLSPLDPDSPRSYIFFEPSVRESIESKAELVEGATLPAESGTAFGVLGYYGGTSLFAAAYSSANGIAKVYRPEDSSPFQYDNLIFWHDQTTDHNFYAFYPYSNNSNNTLLTIDNNGGNPYVVYTQPTSNDAAMVDLMTAYTSTSQCNEVELTFNHRLWAMDIVITNNQTKGVNSNNEEITTPTLTIKSVSVRVEGFPTGANIYLDKDYKEDDDSTPGISLDSATSTASIYTFNATSSSGDVLANSGETQSQRYESLLFLPVSAGVFKYSLNIIYLDSRGLEDTFTTGEVRTINKAFEAGKRYILSVTKENDTFVLGSLSPTEWTDRTINHEFN